jgi:cytochrome c-type biogenesis protein CcmH
MLLSAAPARAVEPGEMLADPVLEGRARGLSEGLRCLVCQNQSIDDSQAPLAKDLRLLVRERLKAGDSDDQVRAYLVARYGDFILLKPPLRLGTFFLWGAPFMVLLGGALAMAMGARRHRPAQEPGQLSAVEKAEIDRLLGS